MSVLVGVLTAVSVIGTVALVLWVLQNYGVVDLSHMSRMLHLSEARLPGGSNTSMNRPYSSMSGGMSPAPYSRLETISASERPFSPLETISASSRRTAMKRRKMHSAKGGRHMMPLETIGSNYPLESLSGIRPLETMNIGDSNEIYAM
jgi:hypothetical protein